MEVVITKCTTTGFTIGSRHCFITLLFQQLLNKLFLPFEMVKQKNITMFFLISWSANIFCLSILFSKHFSLNKQAGNFFISKNFENSATFLTHILFNHS